MTYEFDDQGDDLNEELLQEFASKLENAINDVISNNLEIDPRLELLTTLISFAAQVSQDLGITEDKFSEISTQFYQEAEESLGEEHSNDLNNKIILN